MAFRPLSNRPISLLDSLSGADLDGGDHLAVADQSASETKKITAKELGEYVIPLIDDGTIPGVKIANDSLTAVQIADDAITADELKDNAVTTGAIKDSAVTNAKVAANTLTGGRLVADTISSREIADGGVTSDELGIDAVITDKIANGAVTDDKIASGIDGSKIASGTIANIKLAAGIEGSKLQNNSVTGAQIAANTITSTELVDNSVISRIIENGAVTSVKIADDAVTGDKIAANTITATQLADDSVISGTIQDGAVTGVKIADGTVTDSKIASGIDGTKITSGTIANIKLAAGIEGSKLQNNSVTGTQIAANTITSAELTDNSVISRIIKDGAVTNVKIANDIDASKLKDDSIVAAKINAAALDRGIDKTSGAIGHTNSIPSGVHNGIEFDDQGHVKATSPIKPAELPIATDAAVGAASYPASSGLSVSGIGEVTHTDSLTAGSIHGIAYSETGHITSIDPLAPLNVPVATDASLGLVEIPGPDLVVDQNGNVNHVDSNLVAGVYTKVQTDQYGHVVGNQPLDQSDIPTLDAQTKLSGLITQNIGPSNTNIINGLIGDSSITREKLADFSIAYIQEAQPDPGQLHHNGCLWFQESTAGLHMWNNNSWMAISIGRLSQENLRYCGTVDASTGHVTGVTTFGTAAGYSLTPTMPIGAATDVRTGVYFVIDTAGSGFPNTELAGIHFDPGDWVLCNGAAVGWVKIDALNSGGGGGGAQYLNDLLDVNTSGGVSEHQILVYDSTGQWKPSGILDGGAY